MYVTGSVPKLGSVLLGLNAGVFNPRTETNWRWVVAIKRVPAHIESWLFFKIITHGSGLRHVQPHSTASASPSQSVVLRRRSPYVASEIVLRSGRSSRCNDFSGVYRSVKGRVSSSNPQQEAR